TETAATAAALAAYAAGLPAFVLVKVLAPGFFARQDTATPVKVAAATVAANLLLTLLLMQFLAHVGVAIALSLAGWMQALALFTLLARHGHFRLDRRARSNIPRITAASLAMAAAVLALRLALEPALAGPLMLRLGALRNWVVLQHDYECIFCIVDLHALTMPQDPDELRQSTREVTAAYIAAGIDPERCIIFNQSTVSAHAELAWLLGCLTPLGWL